MKLFEPQTNLTSYTYPIIKIISVIILIVLGVFRNRIFHISEPNHNFLVSFLTVLVVLPCFPIFFISVGELFETYENRHPPKADLAKASRISLEKTIAYIQRQDITEIAIIHGKNIVKIGVSAENKYSSAVFSNRKYYIGKTEYDTLEAFSNDLLPYSVNGFLLLLSIDGLSNPKDFPPSLQSE